MIKKQKKWVALAALVIVGMWFFYPYYVNEQLSLIEPKPVGDANSFGDLYGALNTLFSGFAFLGVIVSILIQSEELNDTRREIAKQTEQFSSQTDAMYKQSFENTFFQLLGLNNEIVKSAAVKRVVNDRYGNIIRLEGEGRDTFREYREYFSIFLKRLDYMPVGKTYEMFHNEIDDVLGYYFRSVYQALKLIDRALLDNVQKKEYANMLRAQLSKHELELLFYNCLSKLGNVKFKPLLEKYEFFEHLSPLVYINNKYLTEYDISVFGFSNRHYFELYLNQLIQDGIRSGDRVYGYFEKDNAVSKVEVEIKNMKDSDEENIKLTVAELAKNISERSLIWVEVESS
ncbi:putative phage abortive infection protein [Aeromonas caviae]|uniref:putative phage abortive infection protein n=1 Tax=Aeromonas caviae TaxID=648 RepID=UPI001BD57D55|nr:putative phage abortive infection protein [Aeromonas caviae]MBS4721141.1 putative phage abortive infection protein [Aeromonas caviae]